MHWTKACSLRVVEGEDVRGWGSCLARKETVCWAARLGLQEKETRAGIGPVVGAVVACTGRLCVVPSLQVMGRGCRWSCIDQLA